MGKNWVLATVVLFLIVSDVYGSPLLWSFRKLAGPSPKQEPDGTVSPFPSPVTREEKSKDKEVKSNGKAASPISTRSNQNQEVKEKAAPPISTGSKQNQKVKEKAAPPTNGGDNAKQGVKEKRDTKAGGPLASNESCNGMDRRCRDQSSMIACIKSFDYASKALVLLIQNEGDRGLKVNIAVPTAVDKKKEIQIQQHQTQKVNISLDSGGSTKIILNAGNGDCTLHVGALASETNFFERFPEYTKLMTPIYGAYFLLASTLVAGGVWACCKFGKRRRQEEIPYRELEMGLPESSVHVETAEGWDQGWDDDWDEDKAVRSAGGPNISANGLSSRTPNKGGWEEDWDE